MGEVLGSRKGRFDLGRVMGIVVHHGASVLCLSDYIEPSLCASESFQGLLDGIKADAEVHAGSYGCQ